MRAGRGGRGRGIGTSPRRLLQDLCIFQRLSNHADASRARQRDLRNGALCFLLRDSLLCLLGLRLLPSSTPSRLDLDLPQAPQATEPVQSPHCSPPSYPPSGNDPPASQRARRVEPQYESALEVSSPVQRAEDVGGKKCASHRVVLPAACAARQPSLVNRVQPARQTPIHKRQQELLLPSWLEGRESRKRTPGLLPRPRLSCTTTLAAPGTSSSSTRFSTSLHASVACTSSHCLTT